MAKSEQQSGEPLHLEIEVLEERIAPSLTGYEGQPGNQGDGGGGGNPGNNNPGGGNTGYEGQPGNQSNG